MRLKNLLTQHTEGRFLLAECPPRVLKGRFIAQFGLVRCAAGRTRINGGHFILEKGRRFAKKCATTREMDVFWMM